MILFTVNVAMVALLAAFLAAGDGEWSRFRGPNGSGVMETSGLPSEFGPERNVIWKAPLPPGHSSPVLSADRIYVTATEGDALLAIALERKTGRELWRRDVKRRHATRVDKRNHPASPSPAVDGTNVVVFFQDAGLVSFDRDGRERWSIPLGPFNNSYGMGSSPIVVDDMVILVCDQTIGSYMLAVDKATGKIRWKVERPEAKTGHSTPVVYRPPNQDAQLLVPGSFSLTAYSSKARRSGG